MSTNDTPTTPPAGGAPLSEPPQFDEVVLALQKDPAGIQKLLDEKRGANGEAKNLRKELDTVKSQMAEFQTARQKEIEDAENAKLSELDRLKKDLGKFDTESQTLKGQLSERDLVIQSLTVQNAALKLGSTRPEYVEFEYSRHLKSLSDDERKAFGSEEMAAWLADFREKNQDFFRSEASHPKPPASTRPGAPPPPGGSRTPPPKPESNRLTDPKLLNPKSHQDLAEARRIQQQIIRGR